MTNTDSQDDQAKEPLKRELAQPTMSELEDIKKMLDNTILDWNRPSQLTEIDAKFNYDRLIPAIQAYTDRAVLNARIDELEKFTHSKSSIHILADKVSYHPPGLEPISNWPIIDGKVIIIDQGYVKERIADLTISVRDGGETSSQRGKT